MNTTSHISLDVWNTLLEPNPTFSVERTVLLADITQKSIEVCAKEYTKLKREADATEIALPTFVLVNTLLKRLLNTGCVSHDMTYEVMRDINNLFIKYPPYLSSTIIDELHNIVKQFNITLSIGSNSNFISGVHMHPWLESQIPLKFGVYSDLLGYSKPNPLFFEAIKSQVDCKHTEILHVGDSYTCDIIGATHAGINSAQVEGPNALISTLTHILG